MDALIADVSIRKSYTQSRNDVVAIQYLRGIAAVLIIFAHSSEQIINNSRKILITLHDSAWAGVDLFFIISGFVMLYTNFHPQPTASHPRWKFISSRLSRVLPLYWIMTIITAILTLVIPHAFKTTAFSAPKILFSLIFLPFPDNSGNLDPILHLGWTLNYEMFFYFCFVLFLTMRPTSRTVALLLLFSSLVTIGIIFGKYNWVVGFYGAPLTLEFVTGCAIALAFRLNSWKAISRPVAITLIICGIVFLIAGAAFHGPLEGRIVWKGVPVAAIILGALRLEQGGALHNISQHALGTILHAIGDSTYSIYLTHIFVVMLLRRVWLWQQLPIDGASSLLFICACVIGATAVGLLVYYCPYVGERALVKKAKAFFASLQFTPLTGARSGRSLSRRR